MKRRLGPRIVGRVWDKAFMCHVGVVFSVPRRGVWVGAIISYSWGCGCSVLVSDRGGGWPAGYMFHFKNQPYIVVGEELFIGLVHDDNVHFS